MLKNNLIVFIKQLKNYIYENPSSLLFVDIEEGIKVLEGDFKKLSFILKGDLMSSYLEMISLFNGGRFGVIDIIPYESLAENQYFSSEWEGGYHKWLVIGKVLNQPLALNKQTAEVYLFEDREKYRCLGDLLFFYQNYVFGEKYLSFISMTESDLWLAYLKTVRLDWK